MENGLLDRWTGVATRILRGTSRDCPPGDVDISRHILSYLLNWWNIGSVILKLSRNRATARKKRRALGIPKYLLRPQRHSWYLALTSEMSGKILAEFDTFSWQTWPKIRKQKHFTEIVLWSDRNESHSCKKEDLNNASAKSDHKTREKDTGDY